MANKLVNIIRNLVKEELSEMARPSFSLKVLDKDKAERLKKLHAGHWVGDMIDLVLKAGEEGTSRGKLADELGKNPRMLQNELKALQDNGIFSKDTPTVDKPEKTPGQRGRKTSDTSREGIVRALFQKFTDNPNFEPTDDDLTYTLPKGLGTEKLSSDQLAKVKSKALGLTKRGRPSSGKDSLLSKVEKTLQKESLSETFLRLQKMK
jgi:hypothetical protein